MLVFAFAKAQSVNSSYLCLANGDIVLADLGNCTTTVVATHSSALFDIAQGDTVNTLYGIRNAELFVIDVVTGTVTSLGILNIVGFSGTFRVDSLVKAPNGSLLGVNTNAPGALFRIDVASMSAIYLGDTGFGSAGDLTFFNGDLYLSADANELVLIDVVNPANSALVGTIPGVAGFNNVFGVVSIITSNPCAANPTYELIATGGNDTRFIDATTAQTTVNCTNLVSSDIFGAAEVAADVICTIDLELTDANGLNTEYCDTAITTINTTVDPATPLGVYSYEWRIPGQAGVIGTSAILPINITTTTVYECTVIDSGRAAPDNIGTALYTVTVNSQPVWNPITNVITHTTYTLPAITGTNIPANTAFFDNPAHTGIPWNTGTILDPTFFTTNPATIYVYGIDANGCELVEQFDIEFVDVQVTIAPGGIQVVCEGDMITLTATPVPAVAYGAYTYNWDDSQGTSYPDTATITVTVSVATTLSVTVNDSGVENGNAMGFDMTDFTVLPAVDITDLLDQNSATGSYTFPPIVGNGLSAAAAYYTQPNGMGTSYAPGDVVTAANFTTLPITIYIYDNNGSCSDEESFELDITTPQQLTVSLSSTDNDFCAGASAVLTANPVPTTAQGTYTYEWREQGTTAVLSTASTLTITPLVTTSYECVVMDSGLTTNNTVTELITINVITAPAINPIANQNVTSSFTLPSIGGINLSGTESFFIQSGGQGISYMTGDLIELADFTTYPVTIYVFDSNAAGCEDEISFQLVINPVVIVPEPETPLFTIPNYVTPNNDGFHDYWNIEINNTDVIVTGIYIFDRYGKLLKQLAPDGIGWDAIYNGNPLPSTTYWYVLNYVLDGNPQEVSGFFAVKR